MSERRCTYKCGDWNCGSYQFNLYKDNIDQGNLCDVHYWQTRAQKAEATSKEPSAEDWVILRLLRAWVRNAPHARLNPTAAKSVLFMRHKLGLKTIGKMVDQLREEEGLKDD